MHVEVSGINIFAILQKILCDMETRKAAESLPCPIVHRAELETT